LDIYILSQFAYYFGVLLAGFLLIFDAFTLFDLLGDISKNHASAIVVFNYFLYLIPLMLYQLAPLVTLVACLVTLAVLAKNNEVIALKASGISLYRLILPLALAGILLAGGMFLLDNTYLPFANQRQDALRNQIKGRPAQTYLQLRAVRSRSRALRRTQHFRVESGYFRNHAPRVRQPRGLGAERKHLGADRRMDS
jgi:lipopolysaccharide export LptBFGC system permease protein LptF